ncbi:hypothetical protein QJS10_CPA07g00364 [Acorus calamus]|uniref:Uncharacterized protein n=1 Tax=Acorus calamus TaxID=4465 RepID=A0AAV9EGQ3_ACOCL|nr:hypothetical protein QJS10_CPA07g00364 [Acorus calamus]
MILPEEDLFPNIRSETTPSLRPSLCATSSNGDHLPPHETHLGISSNPSHSIDLHKGSPSPFRVFTGASSSHLQVMEVYLLSLVSVEKFAKAWNAQGSSFHV